MLIQTTENSSSKGIKTDALAPASDAGIMQKTKQKAQQVVVAGKIKIEEMKIGKLETGIGRQLIDSNEETMVQCDLTSDILAEIADARSKVSDQQEQVEKVEAALESKRSEFCESFGLERIDRAQSLQAEAAQSQQLMTQKEGEVAALEKELPDELLHETDIPSGSRLAELVGELRQAEKELQETQAHRPPVASAMSSKKLYYIIALPIGLAGLCLVGIIVAAILGIGKRDYEAEYRAEAAPLLKGVDDAHALWESGKQEEAVEAYIRSIDKIEDNYSVRECKLKDGTTLEERLPKLYARVIDYQADNGNDVFAVEYCKRAFRKDFTLLLKSDKAKALLPQAKQEYEGEKAEEAAYWVQQRREREAEEARERQAGASRQPSTRTTVQPDGVEIKGRFGSDGSYSGTIRGDGISGTSRVNADGSYSGTIRGEGISGTSRVNADGSASGEYTVDGQKVRAKVNPDGSGSIEVGGQKIKVPKPPKLPKP